MLGKRMKKINSIFLFGALVSLALTISSCSNKDLSKFDNTLASYTEDEKSFIKDFIDFDNSLGTVRNENTNFMSMSDAIDDYVEQLEDKLDDERCPERFNYFFKRWKIYS